MLRTLRQYETPIFFAMLLLANYALIALILAEILPTGVFGLGRFYLMGLVLFSIVFLARGFGGIVDLLRPLTRWRLGLPWFAFAACWPWIVVLAALAIHALAGAPFPAPEAFNFGFVLRPGIIRTILIGALIGEIVWISYALRHYMPRIGALPAAHLVGLVWSAWFAPMVLMNFAVPPDIPLWALFLNQSGIAMMCALLYQRTQSGLLILVLQVSFNAAFIAAPVTPVTGSIEVYSIFTAMYYVLALAALLTFGTPFRKTAAA
ncbi:MAG: hypothetical protein KJN93_04590 [Alphaproteobacteria bacterium]|nr:hypothetical protein [Alphaproteobacteria bacterium]NNF25411.1 hypothetical protein [Paracoccaceae bacterium]